MSDQEADNIIVVDRAAGQDTTTQLESIQTLSLPEHSAFPEGSESADPTVALTNVIRHMGQISQIKIPVLAVFARNPRYWRSLSMLQRFILYTAEDLDINMVPDMTGVLDYLGRNLRDYVEQPIVEFLHTRSSMDGDRNG